MSQVAVVVFCPTSVDIIEVEIAQLVQLATAVLNEHINDQGLCVVCRSAFPCESAVLAEHNTALL